MLALDHPRVSAFFWEPTETSSMLEVKFCTTRISFTLLRAPGMRGAKAIFFAVLNYTQGLDQHDGEHEMRPLTLVALLAGVAFAAPLLAHHSYAMFDRDKDVVLVGTVKVWQWTNPHTWLVLDVLDSQGKLTEYGIEGQSPQVLRRLGFPGKDMMKPGDKVTVHIRPLRDGTPGGQLASVSTSDGKTFGGSPPKPESEKESQ
jgi:hypothetical protein